MSCENKTTTVDEKNVAMDENKVAVDERFVDFDKDRFVKVNNDSIRLGPFELYNIVTLERIEVDGMYKNIYLKVENSEAEIHLNDCSNVFTYEGSFKEGEGYLGNKVTFELKTHDGPLYREVVKGQKYQVIYTYVHDLTTLRGNTPTEYCNSFSILDIVGLNEKFLRDIPWDSQNPVNNVDKSNESELITHVCTICNREFEGLGYGEVSDGIWKLCEYPYQCFICSPTCGMVHTRTMNNLIDKLERAKNKR